MPRLARTRPPVMSVVEFRRRFPDDNACRQHLRRVRWGANLERFICPACAQHRGWWLERRQLVECGACHHQTSVTAGTVFHRRRIGLTKWFWAIYLVAFDKKGVAAIELSKQIRVCYQTAWTLLHKLRRAMRHANELELLQGLVEVDNTFTPGVAEGRGGQQSVRIPVGVALELRGGRPGRVALGTLTRADRHGFGRFVRNTIAVGAALRTSGWGAFRRFAQAGYRSVPQAGSARHWLRTFVINLARMLSGTYHHVDVGHLDDYLAEFVYRANRRWCEAEIFEQIIDTAVAGKAPTYRDLVTGDK